MELMRKKSRGPVQPYLCRAGRGSRGRMGILGSWWGLGLGRATLSSCPCCRTQGMLRDHRIMGSAKLQGSLPQASAGAGSAQDAPTAPPTVPKGFYEGHFFSAHLLWKSPPALNICHSLGSTQFSWNSASGDNLPLLHQGVCPVLGVD